MLFNSLQFAIFFPLVTLIYFTVPYRHRWVLLLASSCIFYMAFVPKYILVLFLLIVVDYAAGIAIEQSVGSRRKLILLLSLAANLGVLGFFKYFNFANENFAALAGLLHWNYPIPNLAMLLPLGLSFHTFQSMSYTVEVYYGNQKAERRFGIYALFVLFYPQLVAGPIERPQNLLPQFDREHKFNYDRVVQGLLLMLGGFLKKVLIADRLALVVNQVYGHPGEYSGMPLIIATYFFGFQVYCDFSGYSDIARGCAQVMGFELVENFNRPYSAHNISEFWRRWHMSLFNWFKIYIYTPIVFAGDRSISRAYLAIFAVFAASGIWHGANWTFVIWGLIHAFYSITSVATMKFRGKITKRLGLDAFKNAHRLWQVFVTFHLVTFSWIFFRAPSVSDSIYILKHFWKNIHITSIEQYKLGVDSQGFVLIIALLIGLEVVQWIQARKPLRSILRSQPRWIRWGVYYAAIFGLFFFGDVKPQQFIYFQF